MAVTIYAGFNIVIFPKKRLIISNYVVDGWNKFYLSQKLICCGHGQI